MALFLLVTMSFMMPEKAKAQIIEVGATAGMSYYIGDVNPKSHLSQSDFGFGALVRYYNNLRWAFRLQYSNMNVSYEPRPFSDYDQFECKISDFSFMAEFNFFDYWTGSKRSFISPYLFAGLSVFGYEIDHKSYDGWRDWLKENHDVSMSVPFGVGVKYSLSDRVGVTLEWRIHKSFTDRLDGHIVDNEYVVVENGKPVTKKQPFRYECDWYNMLGLSVVYRFNMPKNDACHTGIRTRY